MTIGVLLMGEGTEKSTTLALSAKKTWVGRSSECGVTVHDKSVSRRHALLERRHEEYVLLDRESRNGTRVNGVAVMRRTLADGDRLAFGDVEFVFHEVEEEEELAQHALLPEPVLGGIDTSEDDEPPTIATSAMAWQPSSEASNREAIHICQVMKRLATSHEVGLENALKIVARDLTGIRDVGRVIIYLHGLATAKKALWIKVGPKIRVLGPLFPEERLLEVAKTGTPATVKSGAPRSGIGEEDLSAVCYPVFLADVPCGCLYMESEDNLYKDSVSAAMGAAQGLSLGLTLWSSASGSERRMAEAKTNAVVIVGHSPRLQELVRLAGKAAAVDSTVLIRGETGTGKELIARLVYAESPRRARPFIPVHCGAMEETMLGSTLFGHEKGAYTGAVGMKRGLFEEADGGTIFLDEIGDITHSTQVKLLRVLQEGEFMRLGGTVPIRVDVRVIAATNRDLEGAIKKGTFREDLYYRLNILELVVPSLRDRCEDIGELVQYFIREFQSKMDTAVNDISPEALAAMDQYDWPGNVRELRNVIERGLVLAEESTLTLADLPVEIRTAQRRKSTSSVEGKAVHLDEVKWQHIRRILKECGGNRSRAAELLGISRSTLYAKLREIQSYERSKAKGDSTSEGERTPHRGSFS